MARLYNSRLNHPDDVKECLLVFSTFQKCKTGTGYHESKDEVGGGGRKRRSYLV